MARGRFISKEISLDKKVNSLSSPWSMLAFTWLISSADVEGRTYGDPCLVKSIVFPRQPAITVEQVEGFIREWDAAGLIIWYEVEGEKYIYFPNFEKHQVGLRKDREPESTIPPMTAERIRQTSGNVPDEIPVKLSKGKLIIREVKLSEVNPVDPLSQPSSPDLQLLEPDGVWNVIKGNLAEEMGRADFQTWIEPIQVSEFQNDTFQIRVINRYSSEWIKKRVGELIKHNLAGLYGRKIGLEVVVDPGMTSNNARGTDG